ncbi:MAG: BamA/TamA family outer membrane protein [Chitinophagales bacterium]|nr:BamA/TamA family outer membrane protein [Bacteroidota bacterium]MCB9043554.1 BamA/TamA family outer membrane protein [Chitinophagales bacterium]
MAKSQNDSLAISYKNTFPELTDYCSDINSKNASLETCLNALRQNGYWAASFDTSRVGDSLFLQLYTGKKYKGILLDGVDSSAQYWLNVADLSHWFLRSSVYSWKESTQLQEKLLRYAENNGYPFAQVSLSNVRYLATSDTVRAYLAMQPHNKVQIDTLVQQGNEVLQDWCLQQIVGIRPHHPYNESLIAALPARLQQVSMLKMKKIPTVNIVEGHTQIDFFLENLPMSSWSAVLGLQAPVNASDKYKLSGDVALHLANRLHFAETFVLNYRSLGRGETIFTSQAIFPYLPYVPLGIEMKFNAWIQTNFRETATLAALRQRIGIAQNVQVAFQQKNRNLTQIDTVSLLTSQTLPENLDAKTQNYSLSAFSQQCDNFFNPRKGKEYRVEIAWNKQKILPNELISQLSTPEVPNFATLYDSIALSQNFWQIQANYQQYFPAAKQATWHFTVAVAMMQYVQKNTNTKQQISTNDKFRLGGNRLLRGFNEDQFRIESYQLLSVEYRYLWEKYNYWFAFADAALMQNIQLKNINQAVGVGTGIRIATEGGIFTLIYALGASQAQQFNVSLQNSRIHIAYVNMF